MNCGHCRDCKWWLDKESQRLSSYPKWKRCGLISVEDNPEAEESSAYASGYDESGLLLTAADFGCVLFKPNDGRAFNVNEFVQKCINERRPGWVDQ